MMMKEEDDDFVFRRSYSLFYYLQIPGKGVCEGFLTHGISRHQFEHDKFAQARREV